MHKNSKLIQNIIRNLINGKDYRAEIIALINAQFLQFSIEFFKKVVDAKLANNDINIDWYKKYFLNPELSSNDIAINSGYNNSASKEIVIDAASEHYDILYDSISKLVEKQNDIDLSLTIKLKKVSVELNINESLILINTLAVKRAALRGGLWSTAGKRVEKYLMTTLCALFEVPEECYNQNKLPESLREIDFYINHNNKYFKCEVKLMGKGNPESADAIFARESDIFVADKLSDLNKKQADKLNVNWVELRSENGFMKFEQILTKLKIPHNKNVKNIKTKLKSIVDNIKFPID